MSLLPARELIASNLRTLRKVRELTQPELAKLVGMSPRTVARLEGGQVTDPGINQVRALAHALGVSVDLLSSTKLVEVRIAVPERMRKVITGAEGLELINELMNYERVRTKKSVANVLREVLGKIE